LVVDLADDYEDLKIEGAQVGEVIGKRVTYIFERGEITASELIGRVSALFRIRDLEVRQPQIEDTIRRIYEEKLLNPPDW
jgi:ABC-2 type transport system ATP-binding protein